MSLPRAIQKLYPEITTVECFATKIRKKVEAPLKSKRTVNALRPTLRRYTVEWTWYVNVLISAIKFEVVICWV